VLIRRTLRQWRVPRIELPEKVISTVLGAEKNFSKQEKGYLSASVATLVEATYCERCTPGRFSELDELSSFVPLTMG
jgi:hypothetical protein